MDFIVGFSGLPFTWGVESYILCVLGRDYTKSDMGAIEWITKVLAKGWYISTGQ